MKKVFAVCLAVSVLLGVFGVLPFTATAEVYSHYRYEKTADGSVEITEYTGTVSELEIPDTLGGLPVKSIASDVFRGDSNLTKVTMPYGLESIGDHAFYECTSLESVKFPGSLLTIGENAIYKCVSITRIILLDGVKSVGGYAFGKCEKLTDVTFPDSIVSVGEDVLYKTPYSDNEDNWVDGVLYCGNHCLQGQWDIAGKCIIRDGTKTIADSAFRTCKSLTEVILPDSLVTIGELGFQNCSGLTEMIIPPGVTKIGDRAFERMMETFTIKSTAGGEAQQCAKEFGVLFEEIDYQATISQPETEKFQEDSSSSQTQEDNSSENNSSASQSQEENASDNGWLWGVVCGVVGTIVVAASLWFFLRKK